tara:strand:+ start:68 stop:823 length:756 start_codon:yes stop_codon:yes gene_type:complete
MLPKEFKPDALFDLARVGKNNDGGYLICKKSLEESKFLLSFGISDDFSFEENFKKINNIKIVSFDPTVSNIFFIKKIIKNLLKLNLKIFYQNIINYIKFKKFFDNKNNILIKKKIGKGGNASYEHIDFNEIIKLTNDSSSIFLKIDIEGDEYRILDDIINNNELIKGIAIEFHDADLHTDKIINFINKINLSLVHVHPNNYSTYGKGEIVSSLEMTFSKNPKLIKNEVTFPHELDQKNNPDAEDLKIVFKV